ncbi:unnamed protein product [Rhizophagus irregularis]|nr:unnamed protein product [Rhizophagus irregularis]
MSVNKNQIIRSRRQTSWVWQYFKEVTKEIILENEEGEDDEERKKETYLVMQCQVKETPSSAICGKEYIRKDASTVLDSQPLSTVQSKTFRHFIHELDSAFIMPSQETVKKIIYDAFNYSFPQLKQLLLINAAFISLTMDLWTARNRQGYLGVTCSYLNQSFTLCELTLDIAYIRYPHTAIKYKGYFRKYIT